MFSNLLQAFVFQATRRPDARAVVVYQNNRNTTFTWQGLAAMTVEIAGQLDSQRIGFASDNSLADVILPLACMAARTIEVPFDHRLGESVSYLWQQIDGRWLSPSERERLVERAARTRPSEDQLDWLQQASRKIDVSAPALVLWTSGTTSSPKGVVLSHRNLCGNAQAKLKAVPQSNDDVRLTALPLCHAYARTCDLGTWLLSGCTLAVGFGFEAWRTLAPTVRPTLANTVPSMATRLLAADPDELGLGRLRLLGCGGAAMSEADFIKWRDRGVTVIQGYGLTETSPVICSATPGNATAGLVGHFVDGWESEIREGRLFVRGPHVMLGYWNDEAASCQKIDADGWLDTADNVELDEASGQLRILGRTDDVILLSDGRKVHPQSIERDITCIAGIRQAMVVSAGRRIVVWVDADQSCELETLRKKISLQLAPRPTWEQPAEISLFPSPLSQESDELTPKGEIRRDRILANRPYLSQSRPQV